MYTESASLPLQHSPTPRLWNDLPQQLRTELSGCCVRKSQVHPFLGQVSVTRPIIPMLESTGINTNQRAHVCVCVCVCSRARAQVFGASPCLLPHTCGAHCAMPPLWSLAWSLACSQKGTRRPEQSSWAAEVSIPKFRPLSHSICVVFGISGPDKDGVSTWLSWERTL